MTKTSHRPANFEAFCARLATNRDTMPKRLSQTAAYMIGHPDEVAFGNTGSIALAAGVQPSTLVRFAKSIGFSGFSDLQSIFRDRLMERNASYGNRLATLGAQPSGSRLIDGFISASMDSLNQLKAGLDTATFDNAISLLTPARTIYLVARRRAFPPLIQIRYAFAKLGIRSEICGTINGIDEDILSFASPADAAIIISFAPYSSQSIAAANQLAAQGVPLLAVTDSLSSPIAAQAKVTLPLAEADYAGFRSLAASMTVAMALSVAVGEKRQGISAEHTSGG